MGLLDLLGEDGDEDPTVRVIALAICLPIAGMFAYLEEHNKKNNQIFNGEIEGQHVRYIEFDDKNIMELSGQGFLDPAKILINRTKLTRLRSLKNPSSDTIDEIVVGSGDDETKYPPGGIFDSKDHVNSMIKDYTVKYNNYRDEIRKRTFSTPEESSGVNK